MANIIKEVLITEEEIKARAREIGQQISRDYHGKQPILVGILKGSVPFMAELIKNIDINMETEYMAVSSYEGGITSLGQVRIIKDLDISIQGRDIIIVEDIVDTGLTIHTLVALLSHRMAKSVSVACLLDKKCKRTQEVDLKYIGFEIPDYFVIGFGLDYDELYRNLPYIAVVDTAKL